MGGPPVRKIIHSLKLVDYFHVQADNPWYNYYLKFSFGEVYRRLYGGIFIFTATREKSCKT